MRPTTHGSIYHGDCNEVLDHFLLKVPVNTKADDGWTPLLHAASKGHMNAVQHLLNRGAEINSKNIHGWTPLWCAQRFDFNDVAALLKSKGGTV